MLANSIGNINRQRERPTAFCAAYSYWSARNRSEERFDFNTQRLGALDRKHSALEFRAPFGPRLHTNDRSFLYRVID